jgi:hypothetical protein
MAKRDRFCHYVAFFDAAPPGSNPASRVFRYPHSFFRGLWYKNPRNQWTFFVSYILNVLTLENMLIMSNERGL